MGLCVSAMTEAPHVTRICHAKTVQLFKGQLGDLNAPIYLRERVIFLLATMGGALLCYFLLQGFNN
jgi:hypothetical protein